MAVTYRIVYAEDGSATLEPIQHDTGGGTGGGSGELVGGTYRGEVAAGVAYSTGELVSANNVLYRVTQNVTGGTEGTQQTPAVTGQWSEYYDEVVVGDTGEAAPATSLVTDAGDMSVSLTDGASAHGTGVLLHNPSNPAEFTSLNAAANIDIYANTGLDGNGAWSPYMSMSDSGVTIMADGNNGQVIKLDSGNGVLTVPQETGTLATQEYVAANAGGGGGQSLYNIVVAEDGSGDYTTLQEAIAVATEGQSIFIKRGTYTLTAQLDIATKSLKIIGESNEHSIIAMGAFNLVFTATADNFLLENVNITSVSGRLSASSGNEKGLIKNVKGTISSNATFFSINSANGVIDGLDITGQGANSNDALLVLNASSMIMKNSRVYGSVSGQYGLVYAPHVDTTIVDCYLLNSANAKSFTLFASANGIDLRGNSIIGSSGGVCLIDGYAAGVVSGNILKGNHYQSASIELRNAKYLTITGNSIDQGGSGIIFASGTIEHILISSNIIQGQNATWDRAAARMDVNVSNVTFSSNIVRNLLKGIDVTTTTPVNVMAIGNNMAGVGAGNSFLGTNEASIIKANNITV